MVPTENQRDQQQAAYMSVEDAAVQYDISEATIWTWLREGTYGLVRYKQGRLTRVSRAEMDRAIAEYRRIRPAGE